jgi:1-phosphofructokinase family hexose kinase
LLIATPNLAVDRTVRLAELRPGSVLRPSRAVVTAGGKGVNVGRVAAAFGRRATLVGFVADVDAPVITRLFAAEPLDLAGVPVPGEGRVSTIYLEDSGRVTVLNEPGPEVSADVWRRYEQRIASELASGRHETLVCSGSLPPGVPDDGYGRLVDIGHEAGIRVVVDTAREALAQALAAGPDFVTPNLAEANGVLSGGVFSGQAHEPVDETGPQTARHACAAVRALCERGARSAAVTAGAAGTAFGDARDAHWLPTLPVRVVNPIGAGDSFVGGLVQALEAGRDPTDAVTFAVATATASVEQELAGGVDPHRARQIAAQLAGAAGRESDLLTETVM